MTVVCLSWETAHLHGETWISHHRLRYRLFVERQGWDVPSYKGMEHDEFDPSVGRRCGRDARCRAVITDCATFIC